MAVEGCMSKQPAPSSIHPWDNHHYLWELTASSPAFQWRHHGETASSKQRVFFILHHLKRISFSTEHHCRAKLSAAQWDTEVAQGRLICLYLSWEKTHLSSLTCSGTQGLTLPGTCLSWQLPPAWECPEATAPGQGVGKRRCCRIVTVKLYVDNHWLGKSLSYKLLLQDKATFSAQISRYVLSGVILLCQHSPLAHLTESWAGWSSHPDLARDSNLLCTWHFPAKQIIANELTADIKYFRRYFFKIILFVYNYIYM